MTVGQKIKRLRNLKGIQQTELAEYLCISQSNLSKYEADILMPNLEVLRAIIKRFDVSFDYLMDEQTTIPHSFPRLKDDEIILLNRYRTEEHKPEVVVLDSNEMLLLNDYRCLSIEQRAEFRGMLRGFLLKEQKEKASSDNSGETKLV